MLQLVRHGLGLITACLTGTASLWLARLIFVCEDYGKVVPQIREHSYSGLKYGSYDMYVALSETKSEPRTII